MSSRAPCVANSLRQCGMDAAIPGHITAATSGISRTASTRNADPEDTCMAIRTADGRRLGATLAGRRRRPVALAPTLACRPRPVLS